MTQLLPAEMYMHKSSKQGMVHVTDNIALVDVGIAMCHRVH